MKHGVLRANLARWAVLIYLAAGMVQAETSLKRVGCGITKKAFNAELAAAYEAKTCTKIKIEGGGATRGIRETIAMDSDADMGGTCRFLMHGEQTGQAIKAEPVAWDALVVITHKNDPVNEISMDNLLAVYRGEFVLYRLLCIVINCLKSDAEAVKQFVQFALSDEGRQIIRDNGTLPYRDGYHLIRKMLRQNRRSFQDRKS